MKNIFKIKKDHPIINFIREEIIKNHRYGDYVGISVYSIDDSPLCTTDLYGFKFNGNNCNVPCINISVFSKPKVTDAPHIINGFDNGYDYYESSTSCTIKLKNFIDKNPQWQDINEWSIPIKEERKGCFYSSHNSKYKRASIRRPDNKEYTIDFPEKEDDSTLLDWIKPIEEIITKRYYDEIDYDISNNIKRNLSVWVSGVTFKYDYKDGIVEIYDMKNYHGSFYTNLIAIDLVNTIPESTKTRIKIEIESGDVIVKDIILVDYKDESSSLHYKPVDILREEVIDKLLV